MTRSVCPYCSHDMNYEESFDETGQVMAILECENEDCGHVEYS